jgi:hypothetical protein
MPANVDAFCTYPRCKCVVQTSTSQPEPVCPHGLMTRAQALVLVINVAERWGENAEDTRFSDRVDPRWTDAECVAFAEKEGEPVTVGEVKEVRDLWRAIVIARGVVDVA